MTLKIAKILIIFNHNIKDTKQFGKFSTIKFKNHGIMNKLHD